MMQRREDFACLKDGPIMPSRMIKYLLRYVFAGTLIFFLFDCRCQTTDSTAKKPSIWERRQRALEERMRHDQQRRTAWESRPLWEADKPNKWNLSFNAPGLL